MIKPSYPVLLLSGCLLLNLTSCDRKDTAQADAAREKSLQEMQAKINDLSARSEELNKQLADRDAADSAAKKAELEKLQTDLENQRQSLADQQRNLVATATPEVVQEAVADNTGSPSSGSYEIFYNRLQNDGDWIQTEDYGYIWQPRQARSERNWRPYTDGHWVETDRGWTWVSNESFGWATYHYGRWVELEGTGWCWVPGNQWAPAWVSWRSNDRYVGWAPLPPEARLERGGRIEGSIDVTFDTGPSHYTFIPSDDFGETTYVGRVVQPEQNVVIIDQTVNVTNITYNNTQVYNYGPDYEMIRQRSRRGVDRYQLDVETTPQDGRDYTPAQPSGNILKVLAPVIAARMGGLEKQNKPARVEKKIDRPQREKGWKGYAPVQVSETRNNLKLQAREKRVTPVQPKPSPSQNEHPVQPVPTIAPQKTTAPVPTLAPTKSPIQASQPPKPSQPPQSAKPRETPVVVPQSPQLPPPTVKTATTPAAPKKEARPTNSPPAKAVPAVKPKIAPETTPSKGIPPHSVSRPENQKPRPPVSENVPGVTPPRHPENPGGKEKNKSNKPTPSPSPEGGNL